MIKNNKKILIDWVPDNFAAAPVNDEIACIATGESLEEVKKNIIDALEFHMEGLVENGEAIPEEFRSGMPPEFILTTRAQLKYCDQYITRKALAKETGINERQLSHYANGLRHPRPAMRLRISEGIRAIRDRLGVVL